MYGSEITNSSEFKKVNGNESSILMELLKNQHIIVFHIRHNFHGNPLIPCKIMALDGPIHWN